MKKGRERERKYTTVNFRPPKIPNPNPNSNQTLKIPNPKINYKFPNQTTNCKIFKVQL